MPFISSMALRSFRPDFASAHLALSKIAILTKSSNPGFPEYSRLTTGGIFTFASIGGSSPTSLAYLSAASSGNLPPSSLLRYAQRTASSARSCQSTYSPDISEACLASSINFIGMPMR